MKIYSSATDIQIELAGRKTLIKTTNVFRTCYINT